MGGKGLIGQACDLRKPKGDVTAYLYPPLPTIGSPLAAATQPASSTVLMCTSQEAAGAAPPS